MGAFTYLARGKKVTLGFHEVPPDVLEQPQELVEWARRAIQVATASKLKKFSSGNT